MPWVKSRGMSLEDLKKHLQKDHLVSDKKIKGKSEKELRAYHAAFHDRNTRLNPKFWEKNKDGEIPWPAKNTVTGHVNRTPEEITKITKK